MPRMLSPVILPGDPTAALHPGTKQYVDAADALKINSSLLGAVNGVAQLGSGGQVPTSQIPDLSATYDTIATTQTITGQKTFNSGPFVPAAQVAANAIPRSDFDDRSGGWRMSRWGITAATVHPMAGLANGGYGPNAISLVRAFIPAGVAIANLAAGLGTAATVTSGAVASGGFLNGLAVYEISGTTANLAASYTGAYTMWTTAGWATGSLNTTLAAQGSDREVMLALAISVGGTGIVSPKLPFLFLGSNAVANNKPSDGTRLNLCYYLSNAITAWASSYNLTTSTNDNGMPLIAVY
jgi:hypothetical protein